MEEKISVDEKFEEQIDKLLNDFMLAMYRGKDHIIARKYFHELFTELIPKYFSIKCVADEELVKKLVN